MTSPASFCLVFIEILVFGDISSFLDISLAEKGTREKSRKDKGTTVKWG